MRELLDCVKSERSYFMQYACADIATLALKLKHQYRAVLGASPGFGLQKQITKEMDALGTLIKELEDAVVVLQLKLQANQEDVKAPAA